MSQICLYLKSSEGDICLHLVLNHLPLKFVVFKFSFKNLLYRPGRTPPSPLPPTSSHTLVTCPSDSLPIYFNLWTPPASLPSLPEQAPQSTVSITLISTYLFGILFSWIHDMSWASTVKCLNPLSCYQHIWTPCLSTYICNKHELCINAVFKFFQKLR